MFAYSITELEGKHIVLCIRGITQRYVLPQRRHLYVIEIIEGLLEFTFRQFQKRFSIFSLGILNGIQRLNIRFRKRFGLLIRWRFIKGNRHVISIKILLCHASYFLLRQSLNALIGCKYFIYRLSVRKGINQPIHF